MYFLCSIVIGIVIVVVVGDYFSIERGVGGLKGIFGTAIVVVVVAFTTTIEFGGTCISFL